MTPCRGDGKVDILPSFPRLRQQNLLALYGADHERIDKSRAGGVDARIQDLVDGINRHEFYVTLSSCSGRIALFDPAASVAVQTTAQSISESNEVEPLDAVVETTSGKGSTGAWLLVSHDEVDPVTILPFFHEIEEASLSSTAASCSFKFEPMLLHVAAANLKRGQQLLQIALQAGFRESGLVVTDERVTVAIRTQSLGLCIPLSRQQSPLRPPNAYLVAIVEEANRRLITNLERMHKLHRAIQSSLYETESSSATRSADYQVKVESQTVPDLFLYGHATAAARHSETDMDILVFGGYGPGPFQKSPQRSAHVYFLSHANRCCSSEWELVDLAGPNQDLFIDLGGAERVNVEPIVWQACQSIAIASLPTNTVGKSQHHLYVVFGGRKSPVDALGTLWLFSYTKACAKSRSGHFYKPLDVRGLSPSPRWGHTLTSLDCTVSPIVHQAIPIALLTGGRNESCVNADGLYLLSIVPVDETTSLTWHFLWESINCNGVHRNVCRFHHSAVAIDADHVFIFGGLSSTNALAGAASRDVNERPGLLVSLSRGDVTNMNPIVCVNELDVPLTIPTRFGHGVCVLKSLLNGAVQVLLSGGVCRQSTLSEGSALELDAVFQCVQLIPQTKSWKLESSAITWALREQTDMGTLVHHGCNVVSSSGDDVCVSLVGGGAAGFGFQDCYAASSLLSFERIGADSNIALRVNDAGLASTLVLPKAGASPASALVNEALSCHVVYVCTQNAKALKTQLESVSLIDKRYRLTKPVQSGITALLGVDELSSHMAVPVYHSCIEAITAHTNTRQHGTDLATWVPLVAGYGQQACPVSSASFARQTVSNTTS